MDNDSDILPHVANTPFNAYKGDEDYIFVSYAHMDADFVFPELTRFKNMGFNIWYDQGIAPGSEWPEEIAEALGGCSLFVVFISPNSVASKNVRNEIHYALSEEIPLIAIYLTDTILEGGLKLSLGSIQAILKYAMSEEEYEFRSRNAFKRELKNAQEHKGTKESKHIDFVEQFERMNTTTASIDNLGNLDVLIILKDGTNLTSWSQVENTDDILYISENLSNQINLKNKYKDLSNVKVIVARGATR